MSAAVLQREVEELLLQLKGLIHVRALLETRGATTSELEAHNKEIERVRAELARLAPASAAA